MNHIYQQFNNFRMEEISQLSKSAWLTIHWIQSLNSGSWRLD